MPLTDIRPASVFKAPTAPFSHGTLATGSRILQISGQVPVDAAGNNVGKGDIEAQTEQVIANIRAIVEEAGGTLADVSRLMIFLTDRAHLAKVMEVRKRHFVEPYPCATAVVVSGLANPDWEVEIEVTASLA